MTSVVSLVLRLAAPLQSWGDRSQFNRRQTRPEPTKSGIVGLLAAAQGRRRSDPIEDLLNLTLGVRVDQAGSVLRDYHTVSDYRGGPLLSAKVDGKGRQKSAQKKTHVTTRYYLQDAVFVAAISGPADLVESLAAAIRRPAFPLALGRRSCPPTMPLLLTPDGGADDAARRDLWSGAPRQVLDIVPWQVSDSRQRELGRNGSLASVVDLPTVIDSVTDDAAAGPVDTRTDVPGSFEPTRRSFGTRWVSTGWARVGTRAAGPAGPAEPHDPFALLGW
jgi:CRISPR system Cascade subunit CasD